MKSTIETWGKRCDGFIAFSTVTDPEYSAYRIEHEGDINCFLPYLYIYSVRF